MKELKVPVLFISGMEDVIFPPPAAAALANLVPGAKLESVPEAGHSVYFQRPEIFNRLVSDFFEMHQGRAAGPPPEFSPNRARSTIPGSSATLK